MAGEAAFAEEDVPSLKRIADYYEVTKELILFAEQVDPLNKTLPQPINELRNCLDHLMRVVSSRLGGRKAQHGGDYAKTNMDKAYGHVYRAAYDTLDWVSLTLKGRIIDELEPFSVDTIQAALPEYYSRIRPRLETILIEDVAQLRMDKDVGLPGEENLVRYGEVAAELKKLFFEVVNAKSALIEHHLRLRSSARRGVLRDIAVGTAGGVAVLAITLAITLLVSSC